MKELSAQKWSELLSELTELLELHLKIFKKKHRLNWKETAELVLLWASLNKKAQDGTI